LLLYRLLEVQPGLPQKKLSCHFRQPGYLHGMKETRSFPSPSHNGFGFFC
jgi:hypothetical protein